MRRFLDIDPSILRLPPSRLQGVDPGKLQLQIHRFGRSTTGMPPIEVYEDANGEYVIVSGVTRATRVAKLLPGTPVRIEIIGHLTSKDFRVLPRVGERLP
jgi:hypothetical protein